MKNNIIPIQPEFISNIYYLFSMYSRIPYIIVFAFILFLSTGCTLFKNTPKTPKPYMINVNGGTFFMGDIIDSVNTDALPVHEVKLGDYYIGKYEVTFAQYDAFAKATGSELPEDDNYGRGDRPLCELTGMMQPPIANTLAGGYPLKMNGNMQPAQVEKSSFIQALITRTHYKAMQ
jgi:formylglycine-generating enzyme required for sulfatase activity